MAGFNSGYSPDLVYTKLDEVFMSVFNRTVGPQMADIDQEDVFRQDSTDRAKVVTELMADAGMWEERAELGDIHEGTIKSDSSRNFNVVNYDKALKISKNYFDDEQWGTVGKMVTAMANKGFLTSRDNGFDIYRGAFATHTTNDSQYIISDSHTNVNGDTIDNKLTAALAPASLETALYMLQEQKDQAGDIVGHDANVLLVPNRLFPDAVEITESELVANTTDNNLNAFSAKFNLTVKQSNRLSAAAGGSDTAWFLLAREHSITRWIRQAIQTGYVSWEYDDKNRYTYKGEFREVYGAVSYEGIVGSDGTT